MHTASDPLNMPDAALVKKGSGFPSFLATSASLKERCRPILAVPYEAWRAIAADKPE
jgi:hypothetical protein